MQIELPPELQALVPAYLARRREDLSRLDECLRAGDLEWPRQLGHQLAGTGSTYGFEELTRLGRALNAAARAADLDACAEVRDALRAFLATAG